MKKKAMALVLALGLVVVGIVSGTMAWLTASSTEVKNTFTDSDINITLEETTQDYKMIPGWTIAKDPKVTVAKGSEDCYVFVKIDKSTNYDTYLKDYAVDEAWTQLKTNGDNPEAVQGVFYQEVESVTEAWSDYVLAGKEGFTNGYVTVNGTVTKEQMNALTADNSSNPTLTFTAYATQLYKSNGIKFGPYEAWQNVFDANANGTPDSEEITT